MATKTSTIPPDNLQRNLALARPNDDPNLPHVGLAGDTYAILVTGEDTIVRYCLIAMLRHAIDGPPRRLHDFEEMFSVIEGEIEVTFRGAKSLLRVGETANIPANAPHEFHNVSQRPERLLCICSPAGQEEFFIAVGGRVASRTTPPPQLDGPAQATQKVKIEALAPQYRTELLPPKSE